MVDDLNISSLFLAHRRKVVKRAHTHQQLSVVDQFTLNFIFYINTDKPMPSYLTTHEWETIIAAMSDTYPIANATPDDRDTLYTFSKAAKKSINTAMTALPTTTTTEITKLLTNIAQKYDGLDDDDMNEDSFIKNRVDPIMSSFFMNERNIVISGCSTTLESSSMARKQFDPTLRGKMPDLTVSLKEEHATYDIIVMEVKPANVTNKDADLLKLGNMLKDSMDKLHKHGLTSDGVRVFGVLVEGYQCDLYVMLSRLEHTTPPSYMNKTKPSFISPVRLP
ncbi:unnamed protein product [Absidia cylindrospora]